MPVAFHCPQCFLPWIEWSPTTPLTRCGVCRGVLVLGAWPASYPKVGSIRVGRVLGIGGFGVVHEAFDEALEANVVVKVLHGDAILRLGARAPEALRKDARAAARTDHPCLVRAMSFTPIGRTAMAVFARVPGISADQWALPNARAEREVLRVARAALRGLEALHAVGLVHLDVKPGNIMVRVDALDRSVLIDLGIASDGTEVIAATPGYAPPEQFLAARRPIAPGQTSGVGAYTDLYALGASIVAMLCGAEPDDAARAGDVLSMLPADTSLAVRSFLQAIVRDDPHARTPTSGRCLAELSAVIAHLDAASSPLSAELLTTAVRRVASSPPPAPPQTPPQAPQRSEASLRTTESRRTLPGGWTQAREAMIAGDIDTACRRLFELADDGALYPDEARGIVEAAIRWMPWEHAEALSRAARAHVKADAAIARRFDASLVDAALAIGEPFYAYRIALQSGDLTLIAGCESELARAGATGPQTFALASAMGAFPSLRLERWTEGVSAAIAALAVAGGEVERTTAPKHAAVLIDLVCPASGGDDRAKFAARPLRAIALACASYLRREETVKTLRLTLAGDASSASTLLLDVERIRL